MKVFELSEEKRGRLGRLGSVTLVSLLAFVLFAAPSCPFNMGGNDAAQEPAAEPVADYQSYEAYDEGMYEAEMYEEEEEDTSRLSITDDEGNERAVLGFNEDGTVSLVFFDEKGNERSSMGLDDAGSPNYRMFDKGGSERVRFFLGGDDNPVFDFIDGDGKIRSSVQLVDDGAPVIALYDAKGESRTNFYLQDDGDPMLTYETDDGKVVVVIPKDASPTRTVREVRTIVKPPAKSKKGGKKKQNDPMVVIVKGTGKFHKFGCKTLHKFPTSKRQKVYMSDAKKMGYAPDPVCWGKTKARKNDPTVVIIKGTKKYHRFGCPRLKKVATNKKQKLYLSDAKKRGYVACPVCNAPR